ncbi:hypothetical protein KXD40_001530 [Peronospora effusa]|uniref:Saposin B-type domain-containing protein n=1 Tax=Peronospora effusa TaxID=542832 RepID=A0A3M6VNL1_9STRA|nr:hypothetical protein DD238_007855 [Peronospora effusa]UIZ27126.1 hypothetical protein KXD40_001530 [Peronospora effusa]CAI5711367.1 unnamed protein product [Peronospora effusa]
MQNVYKLMLGLAIASAVVNAEQSMRYSPSITTDGETTNPNENEIKTEATTSLMEALSKHFQHSSEMLQNYFHNEADASPRFNEADDVVRIVVIEQEVEDPAVQRKTACLKAMEITRKKEELVKQTESLMRYIRTAFDMVSLRVWGGPSCNDLDRPELVEQCNFVLKSESVVQLYLLEGKTDDQVCDIMSAVTHLNTEENLSCQLCQRFIQMVDQAVSKEGQQVEYVRDIIGHLGAVMSTDSMCLTFYNNYDTIVELVKYGTQSGAVCSRLTMCSSSVDVNGL